MNRRGFLTGLGSLLVTAPAIVHAGNLMPIKAYVNNDISLYSVRHPHWNSMIAADLTENSLLQLMIEIRRDIDLVTGIKGLYLQ